MASRTLADAGSGRRVLIVLTDGDDISSTATAAQVIAAARASDVTIYAIALKSSSFKPVALRRIAEATGGGLFRASTSQIKDVYRRIGQDLHSTYLLQFTSSLPTKKIALTVTAPGASAATASFVADGAKTVAPPKLNGNITKFSDTRFANLFLALAVGVVVLLGALLLFRPSSNQKLQKRIEGYAQISEKRPDRDDGESRSPLFQRLLVATEGVLGRLKYWKHAGFLLQQADMPMRAAELFYIQLGIGAGLGILSMLALGNVVLSLIAFAIGMVLPYMYVKRKAGKRTKKFEASCRTRSWPWPRRCAPVTRSRRR